MSFLVTYYPQREVIVALRKYKRAMSRLLDDADGSINLEHQAQVAFEDVIAKLRDEVAMDRYAAAFDTDSLDSLNEAEREELFGQEVQIVAQTFSGSIGRSEAIVYNSLSFISHNNIDTANDIINSISVQHYSNMDRVRIARRSAAAEKKRVKKKVKASTEYIIAGSAILLVNNTLLAGNPLQVASSTLGAGAILRGIADIRGI